MEVTADKRRAALIVIGADVPRLTVLVGHASIGLGGVPPRIAEARTTLLMSRAIPAQLLGPRFTQRTDLAIHRRRNESRVKKPNRAILKLFCGRFNLTFVKNLAKSHPNRRGRTVPIFRDLGRCGCYIRKFCGSAACKFVAASIDKDVVVYRQSMTLCTRLTIITRRVRCRYAPAPVRRIVKTHIFDGCVQVIESR